MHHERSEERETNKMQLTWCLLSNFLPVEWHSFCF